MSLEASKDRWELTQVVTGYGVVKLFSWQYFFDFVHQEMLEYQTYIWRGHRNDDWLLESTLDRLIKKVKVAKTKKYNFRKNHLEQFKYAARGKRGPNPPLLENENDWWALGQHFGLATPLLDWTSSPFVAAYFAFINQGEKQTRNRAIYALHKPTIEESVNIIIREEKEKRREEKRLIKEGKIKAGLISSIMPDAPIRPEIEFIRPMSDENQRLVHQGGLFTRSPDDTDIKTWVENNYPSENTGYNLMKITIPNKDRESCLKGLNRMNINHLTLFPDLHGASQFCNLFGEIKQY